MQQIIRVLQPGDELSLERFLLPRLETSMFLIGNMRAAGLVDHAAPLEGTYVAAFEEGAITSVVAHFWNRVLILQAPIHTPELCGAAARHSRRTIGGLIGPEEQVAAAKAGLGIADDYVQIDETERLYRLALDCLLMPDPLRSRVYLGRRLEPRDLPVVTAWSVAYQIEALGDTDRPELWDQCRTSTERLMEAGHSWVLEHDGHLVATASFNTTIEEAVQVGGVWTPPALRGRGYGRSVVAASLLDARSEGVKTAILFTGEGNWAAQKAYQALGFEIIGNYRLLLLGAPIGLPSSPNQAGMVG